MLSEPGSYINGQLLHSNGASHDGSNPEEGTRERLAPRGGLTLNGEDTVRVEPKNDIEAEAVQEPLIVADNE